MVKGGERFTVERRIEMRDKQQARHGKEPGWSDYALDCYLEGTPIKDILETFNVTAKTFYQSISKAALYRLMKERGVERMDEMEELTDVKAGS